MDFHVWAKLDTDGRIQSVQSSCTPPQNISPRWPNTDQWEGGMSQPDNNDSEKVVPYVEKKELVYKLDAKVDEMSVMMTQLAELSKRGRLQEKLIKQYEEKLARQEKIIKSLQAENAKLRSEQISMRRTKSLGSYSDSSVTVPKCFQSSRMDVKMVYSLEHSEKSSSWPGDRKFLPEDCRDATDDTKNRNKYDCDVEALDNVDSACAVVKRFEQESCVEVRDESNKANRPSSLTLDFDISGSVSGSDLDVEGHFNIHRRDTLTRNGYSYVTRQVPLILHADDTGSECERPVSKNISEKSDSKDSSNTDSDINPMGHVDCDGYLDMNQAQEIFPIDELVYSVSKDEADIMFKEKEDKNIREEQMNCVDNEAVHASWIDVKNGHYVLKTDMSNDDFESPTDRYLSTDGYLEPKVCNVDYIAIPDDNVPDNTARPPLPLPRVSRVGSSESKDSDQSDRLDRQWSLASSSSSHSSDHSSDQDYHDRRTSLPASSMSSSHRTSPCQDDRRSSLAATRSTHSFDNSPVRAIHDKTASLASLSSSTDHSSVTSKSKITRDIDESSTKTRPSSADMRKDDNLNTVFKDMRTTMEWNKAKRKLISQSHNNTADQAELKLRSIVQDMYHAYLMLQTEKGARLKNYHKERIMQKIKEKIGKSHADDVLSEEFMKKCLDFLLITCKVRTP